MGIHLIDLPNMPPVDERDKSPLFHYRSGTADVELPAPGLREFATAAQPFAKTRPPAFRAWPIGVARIAARVLALATALIGGLAIAAPVEDTIAQRAQACVGCHGKEGRAAADGYYPRIAGKPAGYLYNQLLNFRDGRRQYTLMNKLLQPLTDDYLREIAGYFSSLELPYPPPQQQQGRVSDASMARGRLLVTQGDPVLKIPACVQCHGTAMTGVAPAIPGLLGLPPDYLIAQLGAWQTDGRHAQAPDCMAQVAKLLTPEDVSAVTQWLAAQPLPPSTKPVASLANALPIRCGGVPAPTTGVTP
jgi:cytochrome c553